MNERVSVRERKRARIPWMLYIKRKTGRINSAFFIVCLIKFGIIVSCYHAYAYEDQSMGLGLVL